METASRSLFVSYLITMWGELKKGYCVFTLTEWDKVSSCPSPIYNGTILSRVQPDRNTSLMSVVGTRRATVMGGNRLLVVPCLLLAVAMVAAAATVVELDGVQSSYIVHVAPRSKSKLRLLRDECPAFLRENLPDDIWCNQERSRACSTRACTPRRGFAARLTRQQAKH